MVCSLLLKYLKASEEKNLTKRFGTPEDIAFSVAFLASPLSSYISGVTLPVDGLENLAGDRMELYNVLKKFNLT
jgi:NAD(P)-dependent dehydrogenase (short-subunit alcohol dehydrogenase family)